MDPEGEPTSRPLDRRVFEAIQGYTEGHPQDLVGILHYVDHREKLLLTRDELSDALRRLSDAGRIREVAPLKFVAAERRSDTAFRGLSSREHEEACEAYRRWFWEVYSNL